MMRLNGDINEIHDAKAIAKFPSLPTHCCVWGKDGQHVLAAGDDGVVKVVMVPSGKVSHAASVVLLLLLLLHEPLATAAAA
jgi:hypothetical protein